MQLRLLVTALYIVWAAVASQAGMSAKVNAEVLKAESAFSDAKLHNDTAALTRLLADEYIGVNQWGARRDKKATLDLFRSYKTVSLVESRVKVHGASNTAVVEGIMNESGTWKYLFVRTYVKRAGHWQLLASAHSFYTQPEDVKPRDPESVEQ